MEEMVVLVLVDKEVVDVTVEQEELFFRRHPSHNGVFPGGEIYGGVNWSSPTAGRISGCTIGSDYFSSRYLLVMILEKQDLEVHLVVK